MGGPRSKKEEWIFALHDEGHKTGSNWIYNNAREEYVTKADHDLDIIQQDPIFHTTGRPYWPKNECGAVPHHAPVDDAAVGRQPRRRVRGAACWHDGPRLLRLVQQHHAVDDSGQLPSQLSHPFGFDSTKLLE